MKKSYISPEMDVLLLELSDIITASGGEASGGQGTGGGGNIGEFEPFTEGWNN